MERQWLQKELLETPARWTEILQRNTSREPGKEERASETIDLVGGCEVAVTMRKNVPRSHSILHSSLWTADRGVEGRAMSLLIRQWHWTPTPRLSYTAETERATDSRGQHFTSLSSHERSRRASRWWAAYQTVGSRHRGKADGTSSLSTASQTGFSKQGSASPRQPHPQSSQSSVRLPPAPGCALAALAGF
ncbi:hypothetical protein L207DRAFT_532916 [Hyaloscypha variabilis F]|uniref:Uncharacterized protein n=1 Tax=Hyaloscypha variabilis (strain UAMH 11265 / GT02V1 / F) TaxID=1149755 RepID=A0A2J6RBY7_HYAVF|nr:hypothetical protein L207DRAFT_532916 [Hyaloscypha variabilis F]